MIKGEGEPPVGGENRARGHRTYLTIEIAGLRGWRAARLDRDVITWIRGDQAEFGDLIVLAADSADRGIISRPQTFRCIDRQSAECTSTKASGKLPQRPEILVELAERLGR